MPIDIISASPITEDITGALKEVGIDDGGGSKYHYRLSKIESEDGETSLYTAHIYVVKNAEDRIPESDDELLLEETRALDVAKKMAGSEFLNSYIVPLIGEQNQEGMTNKESPIRALAKSLVGQPIKTIDNHRTIVFLVHSVNIRRQC
jgi:hypothetical protein